MRRVLCVLAVASLLLPVASGAQSFVTYEAITFDNTSGGIAFGATTIRPAGRPPMRTCSGKLETAQIRYRFDGTAPTSSEGKLLDSGDVFTLSGLAYLTAFRGIRTGGTSGVIRFHCTRD